MRALAETHVTVCGVGAIGSNLASGMVRQGFRRIRLVDSDRVEQHNIGNQAYSMQDIGGWKAEVLRNHLYQACEVEAEVSTKRIVPANIRKLLRGSDLVVDALDNSASRQAVQDYCRDNGVPCLHVGLFFEYGEAVWDSDYRVPEDVGDDICEYPLARNLVELTAVIAAELIVRFVTDQVRESYTVTLRDFAVRPLDSGE